MVIGDKFVLNLLWYMLFKDEFLFLSKGLKFIFMLKNNNVKCLFFKDFDEFVRKFKCKFYFDIGDNLLIYFFKIKFGFMLFLVCWEFEDYIDKIKFEFFLMEIVNMRLNIFKFERVVILLFKNNNDIVIKKVDKSNIIVIMNRD